jgi:eukaryotic-like serine/threonine-protein kinase
LKRLGKYEVLGELGHGAMGVVYRARDPIINRLVALKTITTGVADDPAMLQRFYREAQSAGGLQHPNIVTIYDMGEASELPYIAMELIDGENLEQLIARRSAFPITLKLSYAMQACRAFDYAHKRGIVHRDIKPGNVMVSKDGNVKVVDFGIARVLETSRTQTGMLIGTFAYMSPEQYHGEHADERSDIWSFGVLFYELLTYQKPFTGPTPASLMHNICNVEPAALKGLLPECPAELDTAVTKMLQKSPSDRYQSMEDVLLDLEPIWKALRSQSIADLLDQTRRLFDEKRFTDARDLARQAVQLESSNQQARSLLEKANAEIRRLLNRPKAQQFVEKGQALLGEKKLQEAKVAAEQALELDSSFIPAEELQRDIQKELDRARLLAEWLETAKQNLAEGLPDEAETLLAKVLNAEPSNAQAEDLHQKALKEIADREKAQHLLQGLQRARELWTQQRYDDSLKVLKDLANEFPGEEEVSRLFEAVRDDQIEQQKRRDLQQSRNLVASGHHEDAIALLSDLRKQFPTDETIPGLLEAARKDQLNQRRLLGLTEARNLLAAGQFDSCISFLSSLTKTFPEDQEIPKLLETALQNQAEQLRQRGIYEAGKLLAARQYKECADFLANLEKQFPGDREILLLQKSVHEEQATQEKLQGMEKARSLIAARRFDESSSLLVDLEKRFSADEEILALKNALTEDRLKQKRLQALEQARNFLASKNYEKCLEVLSSLQEEFPDDIETHRLLDSTRKEQTEQSKQEGLARARNLLVARHYAESIVLLTELQTEFPAETAIGKLLNSARKEQAEQRQRDGLAQARSFLAARRYDDSIALLAKLQTEFPGEAEITRLLVTARQELAEQQKELKLADARSLLAARSFVDALAVLTSLAAAYPKDSAVMKLRALVQREQEKHAKEEKLQGELDSLKKLIGENRYPEVTSRAKELLKEFPSEPNLLRLVEFASSRQADIERDLLLKRKLDEAKSLVDAGRFEGAMRILQDALKTFPANAELQTLYQQSEIQQKKLQVRQQIEQRVRQIRVKINREELSEAVDLAQQTLLTLGPDTDLTHLLNSAQVELQAREKKRLQEGSLETIRSLIDSGDVDGASRTIDALVASQTIDFFDPRIQRLSARIQEAKAAAGGSAASSSSQAGSPLSKEYAFLQVPPLADVPPSLDKVLSHDPAAAATQDSASATAPPQSVASGQSTESALQIPEIPVSPIAKIPPTEAKPSTVMPASMPAAQKRTAPAHSPVVAAGHPAPAPVSTPMWRKPGILAIVAIAMVSAIWFGVRPRSASRAPVNPPTVKTTQKAAPSPIDPLESQQRQALDDANNKIAANDLDGASRVLQPAAALNGPLTSEIQQKLAQVEESMKDANLRQLRQKEEVLWQRAMSSVADGRFSEAQNDLKQVVALPAGGVRREDAQRYLERTIPQLKIQKSLDAHARQNLERGDFPSARRAADEIKQNGGSPTELVGKIDQAELAQLKQLESQFEQLKLRDDEAAIQQLKTLQPRLQALSDGGPQSNEALTYANNVPAAVADVRGRFDRKIADAAFQQAIQKYHQAAANNDKNGLAGARGDLQSIVQNGGPHAAEAQKSLSELNDKLAALNQPTAPPLPAAKPTVKTEAPPLVADPEATVRSLIQRYAQAFNQRDADALRQVWPNMGPLYARYKTLFQEVDSISMRVDIQKIQFGPDGTTAIVNAQESQESKMKGYKTGRKQTARTFQLALSNGYWLITDVQ